MTLLIDIKQLNWVRHLDPTVVDAYVAHTPFGVYVQVKTGEGEYELRYGIDLGSVNSGVYERVGAKFSMALALRQRANADLRARIKEAIEIKEMI